MALTPPADAIYPKSRLKSVTVLYDGTQPGGFEFSIAELELKNGQKVLGIRHDRNEWNEDNEENGYPVVRGGRPSWFILPDRNSLLYALHTMPKDGDVRHFPEGETLEITRITTKSSTEE